MQQVMLFMMLAFYMMFTGLRTHYATGKSGGLEMLERKSYNKNTFLQFFDCFIKRFGLRNCWS